MNFDTIKKEISSLMDEERFLHSVGVMELSSDLAKIYGIDTEKAAFAGLIHDAAKRLPQKTQFDLMQKAYANLPHDEIVFKNVALWHGPAGAVYVKEKYGVDDEIYDAVFYHTIGRENMSLLEKIIFIADIIEVNRDSEFDWAKDVREVSKKDLDKALLTVLDKSIVSIIKRGLILHPNSILLRNEILRRKNESR